MSERPAAAEQLRRRLVDLGWSQTELSNAIGVSTGIVSRWLSGQRKPSLEMAFRLQEHVQLPADVWRDDAARVDETGEHAAIDTDDTGTG